MYSVRADRKNNRLYLVLDGFFFPEEAQAVSEEVKAKLEQLQPGFDFISDVSTFKPSSPEVAAIMGEAQAYLIEHGLNRFVRIVSEDLIGQMQIRRVSRGSGLHARHVTSLEAAEALLDEEAPC